MLFSHIWNIIWFWSPFCIYLSEIYYLFGSCWWPRCIYLFVLPLDGVGVWLGGKCRTAATSHSLLESSHVPSRILQLKFCTNVPLCIDFTLNYLHTFCTVASHTMFAWQSFIYAQSLVTNYSCFLYLQLTKKTSPKSIKYHSIETKR